MPDDALPADLIRRVRAGDELAAIEFVHRYEPIIRRRVRVWLRLQNMGLRRAFDSMDVCQSVLASFFARATAGQYELDQPGQVVKLLTRMARHKLLHRVSHHQAKRRDLRRERVSEPGDVEPASPEPSPSEYIAGKDLLEAVHSRLSNDERRLAERRADGRDWAAIAAELGGTAVARRKQLTRALDRVAGELGLDD